jgi:hypothetical protein
MKNLLSFLFIGLSSLWPYPLAVFILESEMPGDFTIGEAITVAALSSSIPILIWWLISSITSIDILYRKEFPDDENSERYEVVKSWKHTLKIGSFFSGFVGLMTLVFCLLFTWNLKTFALIATLFPFIRIVYYYSWEKNFLIKDAAMPDE